MWHRHSCRCLFFCGSPTPVWHRHSCRCLFFCGSPHACVAPALLPVLVFFGSPTPVWHRHSCRCLFFCGSTHACVAPALLPVLAFFADSPMPVWHRHSCRCLFFFCGSPMPVWHRHSCRCLFFKDIWSRSTRQSAETSTTETRRHGKTPKPHRGFSQMHADQDLEVGLFGQKANCQSLTAGSEAPGKSGKCRLPRQC